MTEQLGMHRFSSVAQSCLTLCYPMNCTPARLLCPPLSPKTSSNSCPLNQWCYSPISSSVAPFCFCFQSFPAWRFFPMSQLFALSGQTLNISPSNENQGWFPFRLTGLISLQSKGLSRVFSNITIQKHQFLSAQPFGALSFLWSNSHIHTWPLEKP